MKEVSGFWAVKAYSRTCAEFAHAHVNFRNKKGKTENSKGKLGNYVSLLKIMQISYLGRHFEYLGNNLQRIRGM